LPEGWSLRTLLNEQASQPFNPLVANAFFRAGEIGMTGHPAPGDCRIRTPWKSEDQQPKGWRPDLDDGVVVNIAPLQTAGVLRIQGR